MLTLEEAKQLKPGDILIDNSGHRWKVNGQVKTWKRDPLKIRVPLKHGLYRYDALEGYNFGAFGLDTGWYTELATKETSN